MKKILCLFLYCSAPALAIGVATIEGKIASDTNARVGIESESHIYYIEKKSLSATQLEQLKKNKEKVSLSLPFTSIERVEVKKSAKTQSTP